MKRIFRIPIRPIHTILLTISGFALLALLFLWLGYHTVYALPEYATRTGEPCAVCHVNPGGGGPRTLRGMLWAARGRPDQVPILPNLLIAPGVSNGEDLYQVACAGCHGSKGEGLFGMALIQTGVDKKDIRTFVLQGIPKLGMPSFEGQFSNDQLDNLVTYVAGLADGEIKPPPDSYALPPALFQCGHGAETPACSVFFQAVNGN